MKRLTINILALILIIVGLAGCNSLKKFQEAAQDIEVNPTPNPLVLKGDSVQVQIDIKFPPKFFAKKAYLVLSPTLTNEKGDSIQYEAFTLIGEKVDDSYPIIKFKEGGSYTYHGSIQYDPRFRFSALTLTGKVYIDGKEDKAVQIPPIPVGQGIITTQELYKYGLAIDNGTFASSTGEDNGMLKTTVVELAQKPKPSAKQEKLVLYYPLQQSTLPYKEQRKPEIDSFLNTLAQIKENPDVNLEGLSVASYASPDGPIDLNHNLVIGRGKTADNFLSKKFKKAKFEYSEDILKRESTPDEDWEGFKELVSNSNIEDKELILRVLSNYSDPDKREEQIKNMAEVYEELKKDILPKLRRSEIIATYKEREKTDEELINLGKTDPDKLNSKELFYAGQIAKDADKEVIYKNYITKNPDDWAGYNNLAVYYIKQGKFDEAEAQLQKAENIERNSTVLNNLGVLYYAKNDEEKAKENFKAAYEIDQNASAGYNLGVICLKKGKYNEAVKYFGDAPSYNKSLAQLLAGNTTDAKNTIEAVKSEDPYYYYLKAVIAARSNDNNGVISNLQTAINKKSDLKGYAKEDLEFRTLFTDETFKTLVQ